MGAALEGGVTALTVACGQGDVAMVRALLRAAGLEATTAVGAAEEGDAEGGRGASRAARQLRAAAGTRTEQGMLPAEVAAYGGARAVVELLLPLSPDLPEAALVDRDRRPKPSRRS